MGRGAASDGTWIIGALCAVLSACSGMQEPHADKPVAIVGVTIIEVESGDQHAPMTVIIRSDTIAAIGRTDQLPVPDDAVRIEGEGHFLIPGLWDMHTHAHRRGRSAWHYPAYIAHGVTGIRDMGTDLDSATAHRASWRSEAIAPTVWWGSPTIDGAEPVLPFGVPVTDPDEARAIARRFADLGFRFLKVYDLIDTASYRALCEEARRLGVPVEGHVPLKLSPAEVAEAGQRTIEHLTLVLEACIPGTLTWVSADTTGDSMGLLADGRLAASLNEYDTATAQALFARLAEAHVWQVPTLVQMRGAFFIRDSVFANDPRLSTLPSAVRAEWDAYRRETPDTVLKAGALVFERQLAMVGEMHRAGVPFLAGTDASAEPWVFPGTSLHDELALLVEAGFSPLDALRTATLNPARYRGEGGKLIAPGSVADLVLLDGDPTQDISRTRHIEGVVLRGNYLDRAALDELVAP
jgi:imidazolonepropionase-like amidohydrolase